LLVVDDEEGPRQSLRVVFKDDYSVLVAENGARALELAKEHRVDAAMLDIRMSGMSGIDLLHALKQMDSGIEVIMLTAYETVETARQALRLGACDYLTKPFDLSTIRMSVAHAMERRSLSDQITLNDQRLRALREEIHEHQVRAEIARTQGDIYASIVHDLNGPLTVISGFIDIINQCLADAEYLGPQNLTQVRDHLAHITRQVNKCIEISQRYLSFMRARSSEACHVSVNQILADLEELLKVHRSARGHRLTVRPLAGDPQVMMNGTDLLQILLNLAINAFQCSSEPHNVEIHVAQNTEPLPLNEWRDDATSRLIRSPDFANRVPLAAISVIDNGPGIPPEVTPRLFETHFTTKSTGQGTGLGLSIVRRFVNEAHGAIRLQTKPGQGTSFTLYLPAK
jgi:signal transduction histidine kinase